MITDFPLSIPSHTKNSNQSSSPGRRWFFFFQTPVANCQKGQFLAIIWAIWQSVPKAAKEQKGKPAYSFVKPQPAAGRLGNR
jgi:hypothetical protein